MPMFERPTSTAHDYENTAAICSAQGTAREPEAATCALDRAAVPAINSSPLDVSPLIHGNRGRALCSRHMKELSDKPVLEQALTYDDMMSVDSTDELQRLYARRGITFESADAFLYQVRADWLCARRKIIEDINRKEGLPDLLPAITVNLGDHTYSIFSLNHCEWGAHELGSDYVNIVKKTCASRRLVGEMNFSSDRSVTVSGEVPDHLAINARRRFAEYYAGGLLFLPVILLVMTPGISRFFERFFTSNTEGIEPVDNNDDVLKRICYCSIDLASTEPPYVPLDSYRSNPGKTPDSERRSAYMAEFLREVHRLSPGSEDGLLVGARVGRSHTSEIWSFLARPLGDPGIERSAREAALAHVNNDPDRYRRWGEKALWQGYAPKLFGLACGTMTWFPLLYLLERAVLWLR